MFGIVLIAVAIVFAVAMTMNISANGPESPAGQGITLITEAFGPFGGCVIEVDRAGVIQWQKSGLASPWDAERFVPP